MTNSKEIAVLIRDKALIEDIRKYANELIKLGIPQMAKTRATPAKPKTIKAYCVRCAQSIDFDDEKPLCDGCYRMWSRYKDPTTKRITVTGAALKGIRPMPSLSAARVIGDCFKILAPSILRQKDSFYVSVADRARATRPRSVAEVTSTVKARRGNDLY